MVVDHVDRNTLNYSKENLRVCTRSQNQANRIFSCKKTSKYKGVSFDSQLNKWKVSIKVNGKKIHGGYFDSEDLAGNVYNKLDLRYFGEFALLNDIGGEILDY